jgi:hypothetical protein
MSSLPLHLSLGSRCKPDLQIPRIELVTNLANAPRHLPLNHSWEMSPLQSGFGSVASLNSDIWRKRKQRWPYFYSVPTLWKTTNLGTSENPGRHHVLQPASTPSNNITNRGIIVYLSIIITANMDKRPKYPSNKGASQKKNLPISTRSSG